MFEPLRTISAPRASSPSSLSPSSGLGRPDQGGAAAGDDAFLDGGPGGVQGVFEQGLPLLHLGLGRGPDVDLGDAAGQLGQPLLELLAVVLAVGRARSRVRIISARPLIAFLSPPPSTIVVFRLSIVTFLAGPGRRA